LNPPNTRNTRTTQFLKTLDDLDFVPYDSIAENVLYQSIKRCLEQVGIAYSKAVINHICNLKGLSEREILTNCDLFEDAMYRLFGHGAVSVINKVKAVALRTALMEGRSDFTVSEILNPSLTLTDVLSEIRRVEALNFVRKMASYNHIAFLYSKKESLDKMLSVYFKEADGPTAILSEKPGNYTNLNLSGSISHRDLFSTPCTHNSEEPINKLRNWLGQLSSTPSKTSATSPARFAEDDATWWIRNGKSTNLKALKRSMCENMPDMTSVLCAFDITRLTPSQLGTMKAVIKSHDYVIIEEPSFVVYRSNKPIFRHEQ
jgi:hypothetical protein